MGKVDDLLDVTAKKIEGVSSLAMGVVAAGWVAWADLVETDEETVTVVCFDAFGGDEVLKVPAFVECFFISKASSSEVSFLALFGSECFTSTTGSTCFERFFSFFTGCTSRTRLDCNAWASVEGATGCFTGSFRVIVGDPCGESSLTARIFMIACSGRCGSAATSRVGGSPLKEGRPKGTG